jgi:AAA15 family ATPase/GTPase
MFVRCVFNNIYSFGKETEFNMFPAPRFSRLKSHCYSCGDFELLKLASIYGANGAGKSNLIKSLDLLKGVVVNGQIPTASYLRRVKHFHSFGTPTMMAIEFITQGTAYLYALEIGENAVEREELYLSGLGKKEDTLVFERTTSRDGAIALQFSDIFMESDEGKVLKSVLEKNLVKPNKTGLKILAELENSELKDIALAYEWFMHKLFIITPQMRSIALAHKIDTDTKFLQFANELMSSFDVGIKGISMAEQTIGECLNDRTLVEQIQTTHETSAGKLVTLLFSEESDGTKRLIELLLVLKDIVSSDVTYFIDELERSIHPLLIKEIIRKFSEDDTTKGQLIFTTHESNLLNQEIFRQDEIWFAEKDHVGKTDLYPLSEFKEHNTKDIQRGYLAGRYGAIPNGLHK